MFGTRCRAGCSLPPQVITPSGLMIDIETRGYIDASHSHLFRLFLLDYHSPFSFPLFFTSKFLFFVLVSKSFVSFDSIS